MKQFIVIGSGLGGLAVAIRLAASGKAQVKLVERLSTPGGRASFFEVDGYRFDAGPTIITEVQLLEALWQLAGRSVHDDVELIPLEPYYRIYYTDGTTLDYSGNHEKMLEQIAAREPADAEGYQRMLAQTGALYRGPFQTLARQPFLTVSDLIGAFPALVKYNAWMSNYMATSRFFKHPFHKQIFSFHPLFIGGNPKNSSAIYSVIPYLEKENGVHYTKGGTSSLIKAMVKLFEDLGGTICYDSDVTEIRTENGRAVGVLLNGDEYVPADAVVSNADIATVYREMLPGIQRRKYTDQRLNRMHYSMSAFLLYGGTNRTYPNMEVHNVSLGDYNQVLVNIFKIKRVPERPSVYVYIPSRIDPTMAPEGGESFYVLAPVPHLTPDTDWDAEFPAFREKVLDELEFLGMEGIRDALVVERYTTPVDFQRHLRATHGNAFSFEPRLFQSAYWRPHNRSEEVPNLYFVGAGTHPGAGLPGTLLTAEVTMKLIHEDYGI